MTKPFAWSYSSLTAFETCPYRWKLTKLTKEIVEPQTEQTIWGNRVHKALEHRVASNTPLPEGMTAFEPLAATIAKHSNQPGRKLRTEQKLALTKDFKATTFFAKDVWLRSIADVMIEGGNKAFVGDWKTGKESNAPDSAQLMLSSAVIMHINPYITEVVNSFLWLKSGNVTKEVYRREDIPQIWNKFLPRVARVEAAIASGEFPKRPSGLCRNYCPIPNGRCEHSGKR